MPHVSEVKTVGRFSYAHVDTDSDRWMWAIVTDYEGCQDYGDIICAFDSDNLPNETVLDLLLEALNFEYDTSRCELEDLTA